MYVTAAFVPHTFPLTLVMAITFTSLCTYVRRYGKPRAASVIAVTDGILWSLDRGVFRRDVLRTVTQRRDIMHTLNRIEMLKSLNIQQLQRLCDLLSEVTYEQGSYIIRQGEIGDTFYVIVHGRCDCTINSADGGPEQVVLKLKDNDYFGERALLSSAPRAANVIAVTKVRLLYIGKAAFEEVLGPLSDIIDKDRRRREAAALESLRAPEKFESINLIGVVASDNIGPLILAAVDSAVPNVTIRTFVLTEVEAIKQSRNVLNCIDALRAISGSSHSSNALLPRLLQSYRESNALHMLFNVPIVADLSTVARAHSVLLPVPAVTYIGASIVCALEILHQTGIVYRSIQPETIHVDTSGRVVLMDYRFSKVGIIKSRSYTICGAADYLAPEQISQQGHGYEVDFWSLGILLYELSTGEHPFANNSEVAVFSKISSLGSTSLPTLPIPANISTELSNLISRLIVKEPQERLGTQNIDDLKRHEVFNDIDWPSFQSQSSPLQQLAAVCLEEVADTGITVEMKALWALPFFGAKWLHESDKIEDEIERQNLGAKEHEST